MIPLAVRYESCCSNEDPGSTSGEAGLKGPGGTSGEAGLKGAGGTSEALLRVSSDNMVESDRRVVTLSVVRGCWGICREAASFANFGFLLFR